MLLNPNQQQTDNNQPKQPKQVDPDEIPQEKKEADMRALLQALAIKTGRRVDESDILKSAPQDPSSNTPNSVPNPFRDKKIL